MEKAKIDTSSLSFFRFLNIAIIVFLHYGIRENPHLTHYARAGSITVFFYMLSGFVLFLGCWIGISSRSGYWNPWFLACSVTLTAVFAVLVARLEQKLQAQPPGHGPPADRSPVSAEQETEAHNGQNPQNSHETAQLVSSRSLAPS